MPATAGRVRMPANNRVHSSAALQTHGIWQSAIGYDPYAPNKDDTNSSSQEKSLNAEPEAENAYASFQGLLALARITGSNADEARGACKRCGRVGHLAYQCRNFLSVKDDDKEKDPEAAQAAVLSGLEKIKGNGKFAVASKEKEVSEEEEDSDTSDSEVDSEIERIIAERHGKKAVVRRGHLRKRILMKGQILILGRHRRKTRKPASPSDSDLSGFDDSRVGRATKRYEKRSKKRHLEEDD
ncbi:hypothetical protein GH714_001608 [Hevea brasiliensis]|uniref:CCHC-type domain-containing protein n=1 Tax=Hevea brasiliensis TaxID=3981 RepID=A0A6A6KQ49_HEVBR|nr:hypothetical protein GH714_001608 [Hevea brasiliensis]